MLRKFLGSVSSLRYGSSRRPLTSKHGNKDYYKGKGGGAMGKHTKYGGYIIDANKIRDFIVPDLRNFTLKAYVSDKAPEAKSYTLTPEAFFETTRERVEKEPSLAKSNGHTETSACPPLYVQNTIKSKPSPLYTRFLELLKTEEKNKPHYFKKFDALKTAPS